MKTDFIYVAIKFIEISNLDSTEDVDRVFNEIRILHNFKHSNIVNIKDSFLTDRYICIVMEYCRGGELKQYVRE